MKQASVYVYQHRGIQTRLMAIQPGIIRVTHTRRDAYLENPSPSVICQNVTEPTSQTMRSSGVLNT